MKTKLFLCLCIATTCFFSCSKAQTNYPCETFETPAGKTLLIHMIHHGSIALSYDGFEIQIDPITKDGLTKINYDQFPKADVILVSHEHFDHFDKDAIEKLSKKGTRVLANQASASKMETGEVLQNGDTIQLNDAITLIAVPAYNTTSGHTKFHPKGNGNGFLLNFDGMVIYVSGDTECIEEMKTMGNVDIAFLSTNQPYTMTPEQCIQAAQAINPKVLIPYHLGDTKTEIIQNALQNSNIDVRIFEELR